jgi:hypothetical protein
MQITKLVCKIGVIGAMAIGVFAVSSIEAAAHSEAKPKVESLFDGPLVGVPGMQLMVKRFTVPPGFVGGQAFPPRSSLRLYS